MILMRESLCRPRMQHPRCTASTVVVVRQFYGVSMVHGVCGVQCVVYSMWCAVCGVAHGVQCTVWCLVCSGDVNFSTQ